MNESPPEVVDASADRNSSSDGAGPAPELSESPAAMHTGIRPVALGAVAVGAAPPLQAPDLIASSPVEPQPTTRGKHYRRRERSWQRQLASWAVVIVLAGGVALGLRLAVVQTFFVPSGSMEPTLQIGDRILVQKLGYTIQRGAILVFRQPPRDFGDPHHEDLVKRVIGLPGDTIWSVGNTVYINGKPLSEPYLPKGTLPGPAVVRQTIPAGDYFMMGDNRGDSADSRVWGVLPRSYVVGRVFLVIWRNGRPAFHDP
jgi:signal peptidase I